MMDQHAKYTPKGLITEFVGEVQSNEMSVDRVIKGEVQLVYIHKPRKCNIQLCIPYPTKISLLP